MADAVTLKKGALDHVVGGIGFMLPCVVAGGILMGVGFMLDSAALNPANYGHNTALADFFSTTGAGIFGFMLPVLAAGIGYSLAGRGAIPAGLLGGFFAAHGSSGFLGALAGGFIAGWAVLLLGRALSKMPESLDGVRSLLLIPLLSVLFMGLASIFALEPFVGAINQAMNAALQSLSGEGKILLGFIVAGMEAVDMGGPVNKTAYLFAVAAMANGQYDIMAAVLAGGIIPPYVTALSTTLYKKKFSVKERQAGLTNYIIGLAGITEAAIPFWAADFIGVTSSCVVGAGLAGAASMYFGCSVMAPFGGVFIFPLNSNLPAYIASILLGIAVGTALYGVLGRRGKKVSEAAEV